MDYSREKENIIYIYIYFEIENMFHLEVTPKLK